MKHVLFLFNPVDIDWKSVLSVAAAFREWKIEAAAIPSITLDEPLKIFDLANVPPVDVEEIRRLAGETLAAIKTREPIAPMSREKIELTVLEPIPFDPAALLGYCFEVEMTREELRKRYPDAKIPEKETP